MRCHLSFLAVLVLSLSAPAAAPPPAPCDAHGDLLPPGARLRLGTTRFRFVPSEGPHEAVVVSADRKRMALTSASGQVLVCSTLDGKAIARVGEADRPHHPAAFSADGRLLATLTQDGAASVWDLGESPAKLLRRLPAGRWAQVAFPPGGKSVAIWDDGHVLVRDLATGKTLRDERLTFSASTRSFSPDGARLVARRDRRTLQVQPTDGGRAVAIELPQESRDPRVDWSADGRRFVVGSWWDQVLVFDAATGKELARVKLKKAGRFPLPAALAPDGKTLAVAQENALLVYGLDGKLVADWKQDGKEVVDAIHYLSADRLLVSTARGTLSVLDLRTGKRLPQPDGPASRAAALAFSGDGGSLVCLGEDGVLLAYDLKTGRVSKRFAFTDQRLPGTLRVANGGRYVAHQVARRGKVRGNDTLGDVTLVDLSAGKVVGSYHRYLVSRDLGGFGSPAEAPSLSWSPDGQQFALTRKRNEPFHWPTYQVTVVETKTQKESFSRDGEGSAAFSPDGRCLAVQYASSATARVNLLDPHTGRRQQTLEATTKSLSISLTSLSATMKALLATARDLVGRGPHNETLFSLDGRLVGVVGESGFVVWERQSGEIVTAGQLPEGFHPQSLALAADGRVLVAGRRPEAKGRRAQDVGPAVWDSTEGFVWSRRHAAHSAMALSADGRSVAVGQDDTTVLVYDLPRPPRQEHNLTPAEVRWLWDDLRCSDAVRAWAAVRTLAQHPGRALPLLSERLKAGDGEALRRLVSELDDDDFDVRQAASKKLADMLERREAGIEQALRELLAGEPSLEVRARVGKLLEPHGGNSLPWLPTGESLRNSRAVAVLELIGDRDAVELLKKLAAGVPGPLPSEAKAALARLAEDGRP